MSSFSQIAVPTIKNIERLVLYVIPHKDDQGVDNTFKGIIEFKNFILSNSNKEINLNNGINIRVPIVETNVPPVIFEDDNDSDVEGPSTATVVNDNYLISINSRFCFNKETKMNTHYAMKKMPNFINIFALTTHNGVEVPAFLITITIWSDLSNQTEKYSLWVESLCSNQSYKFIGASNLLRMVLALCKKFNRTTTEFKIVNSYLEAVWGVEQNYVKYGYAATTDFKSSDSNATLSMKRDTSPSSPYTPPYTPPYSPRSPVVAYPTAEIGNVEQEDKLLDGLESGEITWIIDRTGDRSVKSKKSRRKTGKRKPKPKPKKSRKSSAVSSRSM